MQHPVLYSFRRCPYAIRARMVMHYSGIAFELREVDLKNRPKAMLDLSPKGTVPVLLVDGRVLDESLKVMQWALVQSDSDDWSVHTIEHPLIQRNDGYFKYYLDRYKYSDRYPDKTKQDYRDKALDFLNELESSLVESPQSRTFFMLTPRLSMLDVAIFPFVRQFAFVDKDYFDKLRFPRLQGWLDWFLASTLFNNVMSKYPLWDASSETILVGG